MEVFTGFISPFPYDFAPRGWSKCAGQLLSIPQNDALFSLLGTNFGGDGRTTFGLPDLRGRLPIGIGDGPGLDPVLIGQKSGANYVTLTPAQTPLATHTHAATFTPSGGSNVEVRASTNPTATTGSLTDGSYIAAQKPIGGQTIFAPATPAPTTTIALGGVSGGGGSGTVTVAPNNPTQASPVSVMNPYLALSFCIAMFGIFPSRN
ncbi:MAG: tail fiber protein [Burkholderiales bacterium]|nr:tail fiber protein [Burkholderiales bacterium]